ncbi:hypothetical protein DLJ53_25765 [Acuticoccus sediminis]|uniref:Uncharacterized protein n=1 Tax=Acuticoccus sediminis TaxID=2184697 RepID=A0A8B2NTX4_9HYPH|nr:hypothetical protein [Acuticoccus sediminis]RAH99033.1 hypothetical protein DLJ53_25765 [Acuticoccus sediminis]
MEVSEQEFYGLVDRIANEFVGLFPKHTGIALEDMADDDSFLDDSVCTVVTQILAIGCGIGIKGSIG